MRLIREPKEAILGWAGAVFYTTFREPCYALGIVNRDGKLAGAVVFNDFDACNIEMTIVAPNSITPNVAREIFGVAFLELGCRRISLTMREKDSDTIAKALRWGWVKEGRKRNYYPDDHAIILGMLAEECRFLKPHAKDAALAA